jgi:D-aminopeptidase
VLDDFCYLNSPIVITNGFNVGAVYNAIFSYALVLKRVEIWPPLVIGIDDSYLSDMTRYVFKEEEILDTLSKASDGPVQEGSVGAGLGLTTLGRKGGIGSASRILSISGKPFTLGALVASNHSHKDLDKDRGSLTVILGTDIPVLPHQIKRIVQGLANSVPSSVQPDFADTVTCLVFSTANPMSMENEGPRVFDYEMIDDSFLGQITRAGREAVGEAILNSLLKATPVRGKLGRVTQTIPDSELAKFR